MIHQSPLVELRPVTIQSCRLPVTESFPVGPRGYPENEDRWTTDPVAQYARVNVNDAVSLNPADQSLLICGRASEALDLLPAGSVQTVVTSPPYWSLRDYEVEEQIGRDETLWDYIASIVDTFAKLQRVLAHDGTVWLSLGDAYTTGNRRYRAPD